MANSNYSDCSRDTISNKDNLIGGNLNEQT